MGGFEASRRGEVESYVYDCRCCNRKLGFAGLFVVLSLLQGEEEDAAALVAEHEKHNTIEQQWLRWLDEDQSRSSPLLLSYPFSHHSNPCFFVAVCLHPHRCCYPRRCQQVLIIRYLSFFPLHVMQSFYFMDLVLINTCFWYFSVYVLVVIQYLSYYSLCFTLFKSHMLVWLTHWCNLSLLLPGS